MVEIILKNNYLTLSQFLKLTGNVSTGGAAKFFLEENTVIVNNQPENRRGRKLYIGDIVELLGSKYIIVGPKCW